MAYKKIDVKCPVLKQGVHYLTSDYGYRTLKGKKSFHSGVDLIGKGYACDYIIAIDGGKVITSKYSTSAGYYVEIKHENGVISRYLHMKKGSLAVKKGDTVTKGQTLGYMGSSGNSTGAHLHFGIKENGNNVDPKPYLMGEKTFEVNYANVIYQVYDNNKKKWLGEIINYNNVDGNGYAGIFNSPIGGLRVKLSDNTIIRVKSHIKGEKWLSEITKWDDTSMGYSGIKGKPIDAIMIKADNHKIKYRVYANKKWYGWVSGYSTKNPINGYAGVFKKEISAIQIQVVD